MVFSRHLGLSPHFVLGEFTRSDTARKYSIPNEPNEVYEVENMRALCLNVLEPARAIIGAPIEITSGFRSPSLNACIGGARHSQHMLGEAADIVVKGRDMIDIAYTLTALDTLPFDQLIFENRRDARCGRWTQWIHISHRRLGGNRGDVLTIAKNGKWEATTSGIHTPEAALEHVATSTMNTEGEA